MKHTKGKQRWMVVKVDFEKAYDRVKWDFLKDTLYEVALPTPLNRIIMSCVSTSLMQLLWNSLLTDKFTLTRGIRQGGSSICH